ncbi:MAG: M28 family peptidase [Gemmatimonadetes bacterium]|nr:M28 family peptidase [Gemmatimonadota bacterium]
MKRALPILSLIVLAACENGASSLSPGDDGVTPTPPTPIAGDVLLGHLYVLAHDSMQGRQAGSVYELMAATYLREEFTEYGLEPGATDYFQPFTIPVSVNGETGLESQNVLGVLPGQGALADEWVVVGAHYDHVGVNSTGDVFNGADDNASGTSLVLELARYLDEYVDGGMAGDRARRSVMFHGYGAEEVGLVGSTYFCSNPTVPMGDIMAMINLDMVGRMEGDRLLLIGTSSSDGWPAVFVGANSEGLELVTTEENLDRSDQYCFYTNRRPVMFLHTGLHLQYHTSTDDVELIDVGNMERVGEFAANVLLDLIHRTEPLVYGAGIN